jgi:hypothetical protein
LGLLVTHYARPSLTSFTGRTAPFTYAAAAPALLASQHLAVMLAYQLAGWRLVADTDFWLLPLRRLALMPNLSAGAAALTFAFSLLVAWGLAVLSVRRARWSGKGYLLASLAIVPGVQVAAILLLALLPRFANARKRIGSDIVPEIELETELESGTDVTEIVQGVLACVTVIVAAVLVSAVTFGAYGWGLFVMTPLLVGLTTGFLAKRRALMRSSHTSLVVLAAAALGTVALVMFALEGAVCILLAAPLGAVAAMIGGAIGRAIARTRQSGNQPLMSVALLPALFVLEAAMPPAVPITGLATIDIDAPPSAVWDALTSSAPIAVGPGLIGATGLAYPVRGRLLGAGVGAIRLGEFSTGIAREQVTQWGPGRRLAFVVLRQPPAMEEMSPYRRVYAPHVSGYFDIGETRFLLTPLPGGGTRLGITSVHLLRIDPALYWQPVAQLAIRLNLSRVLDYVRIKAEHNSAIR